MNKCRSAVSGFAGAGDNRPECCVCFTTVHFPPFPFQWLKAAARRVAHTLISVPLLHRRHTAYLCRWSDGKMQTGWGSGISIWSDYSGWSVPTLDKYFRLYQILLHVYMTHRLKGIPSLASQVGAFPATTSDTLCSKHICLEHEMCMCVRHYNILRLFTLTRPHRCCVERCAVGCVPPSLYPVFLLLCLCKRKRK
jgi:hypothetical protein